MSASMGGGVCSTFFDNSYNFIMNIKNKVTKVCKYGYDFITKNILILLLYQLALTLLVPTTINRILLIALASLSFIKIWLKK